MGITCFSYSPKALHRVLYASIAWVLKYPFLKGSLEDAMIVGKVPIVPICALNAPYLIVSFFDEYSFSNACRSMDT